MTEDQFKTPLDLQYKTDRHNEAQSAAPSAHSRLEAGPSSLVGLRGDNLTFHTQGASKKGYMNLLWGWAWKDLAAAFLGLLQIFLPSKRQ
ncbi:hypothetical protein [Solidesulfovibrio magneticus]|uniref:hypothetical protein n=1 Tax=Solidesulfovibrio magneticus TaxID=184917 RepID=UPI0005B8AAF4|nr:hypothetical protein [Solidesulfovibrio magneticus]